MPASSCFLTIFWSHRLLLLTLWSKRHSGAQTRLLSLTNCFAFFSLFFLLLLCLKIFTASIFSCRHPLFLPALFLPNQANSYSFPVFIHCVWLCGSQAVVLFRLSVCPVRPFVCFLPLITHSGEHQLLPRSCFFSRLQKLAQRMESIFKRIRSPVVWVEKTHTYLCGFQSQSCLQRNPFAESKCFPIHWSSSFRSQCTFSPFILPLSVNCGFFPLFLSTDRLRKRFTCFSGIEELAVGVHWWQKQSKQ